VRAGRAVQQKRSGSTTALHEGHVLLTNWQDASVQACKAPCIVPPPDAGDVPVPHMSCLCRARL
jgi:hypothetical protein